MTDKESIRLILLGGLTFAFSVAELFVGYAIYDSAAMMSDGIHNLSDAGSLAVAYICRKRANDPPSREFTFGVGRLEVFGALVNGIALQTSTIFLVLDCLAKLLGGKEFDPDALRSDYFIIAGLGLFLNTFGAWLFGGHAHHHHDHGHDHDHDHDHDLTSNQSHLHDPESNLAHKQADLDEEFDALLKSPGGYGSFGEPALEQESVIQQHAHSHGHTDINLHAVFMHSLADALSSVLVLLAGWLGQIPHMPIRQYYDVFASVIIIVLMWVSATGIVKSAGRLLLEAKPVRHSFSRIKMQCEDIDGVIGVHHLHIWEVMHGRSIATVHVAMDNAADHKQILGSVQRVFHHNGVHNVTVQTEAIIASGTNSPACEYATCDQPNCLSSKCCDGDIL